MWQAAGNAARAAGRFARRHRQAIVVGGVVGVASCVYHSMKKALKEVSVSTTAAGDGSLCDDNTQKAHAIGSLVQCLAFVGSR